MKLKCDELAKLIMECFDNSMDNRFPPKEREKFLVQGTKLRHSLADLLSANFEKGTAELSKANKMIKEINTKLKEKDQVLKNTAEITGTIADLTSVLDDLLKLAASFM